MEMKVVYPTKEGVLVKSLYIEGQEQERSKYDHEKSNKRRHK